LVERAGSEVYAGKILDVFHEGVAVLVASRQAGEYEDGGTGVSPKPFNGIGHRLTIPISDLFVKELEAKR